MKKKIIGVVVFVAGITWGQWLPVAVNTNTGQTKPIQFDTALFTNVTSQETTTNFAFTSNKTIFVQFKTNTTSSGGGQLWSTYQAVTDPDIYGFMVKNAGAISTTGKLVLGVGVFATSNEVPAPASSNVWFVYAFRFSNTNYLMGVDHNTNRAYIGNQP